MTTEREYTTPQTREALESEIEESRRRIAD